MKIEPFYDPYPYESGLSKSQENIFNEIKIKLDSLQYIDVEGNNSYIMLYLNKLVAELIQTDNGIDYYARKIGFIKQNYEADFLQKYCSIWLGDVFYFFEDYKNAIISWQNGLQPEKIWSLLSSKIISLKLQEDIHIAAIEALSYKKEITKFAKSNMNLEIQYVDEIIRHDYLYGNISTKWFLNEPKIMYASPCLFPGCIFGYDINKVYNQKQYARKKIQIEGLSKLSSYISDVTRRAENAIREDQELPRIGEGWISETELYYKIKEHFNMYTVIQHYNSQWLGKQHLDVYIEELNTGIEYHGQQHYQPIEFFGGSQAFLANQRRDRSKMQKCKMNSTHLIIVREGYDIKYVINEIESLEENLYRRKS